MKCCVDSSANCVSELLLRLMVDKLANEWVKRPRRHAGLGWPESDGQ